MDLNRARAVEQQFINRTKQEQFPKLKSSTMPDTVGLSRQAFIELFHSQCVSRHLDLAARQLKDAHQAFYTIGSSGHEGNAAIAEAFSIKDIAFLHYRSCAFVIQRAKQNHETDYILDQLLALIAAKDDPIAGGRHKVFGSASLNIPPQTSTIASHLPKSVGAALGLIWSKSFYARDHTKLTKKDSVVICSFGDGSANHASAQSAFNAAGWIMRQGLQLPIVFVCEDNGRAISVPTPQDWIQSQFEHRQYIRYISCDGCNLADVYKAAKQAERIARQQHYPVFLHMKTVRLMGHAGSDIESGYRNEMDIVKEEADDPLLHTAHLLRVCDWLSKEAILEVYQAIQDSVQQTSRQALKHPRLSTQSEITSAIIPPKRAPQTIPIDMDALKQRLGKQQHWLTEPRNMAQHLNLTITELMLSHPRLVLFGEDVAQKGGVYSITKGILQRFGHKRIFDTLLDEQTILGTAIGFAQLGLLPMPEIQFLAYTVNAFDQIRGEAATLAFFSKGQFTNPMVIRIPAFAYQKGFGGHFHNDNAIAFLRELPGVIVVTPSQAVDAGLLLKESVRLADEEQRVVIFLEPIALYMQKDRFQKGDQLALQKYPQPQQRIPYHEVGTEGAEEADILIVSFANGMHLARQAAKTLKQTHQVDVQLLDIRWLHPLPTTAMQPIISNKKYVLIVDETRKTGSVSEEIVTWLVETFEPLPAIERICAVDCFIPLGDAFEKVLPSHQAIIDKVLAFAKERKHV